MAAERPIQQFISNASREEGFRITVWEELGIVAKVRGVVLPRHYEEFHSASSPFMYEPGVVSLKANQRLVEEQVELNPETGKVVETPFCGVE